jgi:hypothetical protein
MKKVITVSVRFEEVLIVVYKDYDLSPCNLVGRYQHFGGICYFHDEILLEKFMSLCQTTW